MRHSMSMAVFLHDEELDGVFPGLDVALTIYWSVMVTGCLVKGLSANGH